MGSTSLKDFEKPMSIDHTLDNLIKQLLIFWRPGNRFYRLLNSYFLFEKASSINKEL